MAFIVYLEKQENGKRSKVITRAEAEKLIYALNHPDLITDEKQLEKLARIQDVHLGRTVQPQPQPQPAVPRVEDKLTNIGVQQGMASALPRNDQ